MSRNAHFAVTAMVALITISGVVVPIEMVKSDKRAEVDRLAGVVAADADLSEEVTAAHENLRAILSEIESRPVKLLADTPQGHQDFENALLIAVEENGVNSVRLDRKDAVRGSSFTSLRYDQQIEGDAYQIHAYLDALDRMPWVTRCQTLSVEPGDEVRRAALEIAVVLEPK